MTAWIAKLREIRERRRPVLVLGAGKTGLSLAAFFSKTGIRVSVWDQLGREQFIQNNASRDALQALETSGVEFCFAAEERRPLSEFVLLLGSPGIAPDSELYTGVATSGIETVSELELGMLLYAELFNARQVVITGSNGKSTTSALIHYILDRAGLPARLCGNIGRPLADLLPADCLDRQPQDSGEILVIEGSSYQIEAFRQVSPQVAVMLNLTENHLERHGNMQSYFEAKHNLVRRFSDDSILVVNSDDRWCIKYRKNAAGRHFLFGQQEGSQARIDFLKSEILLPDKTSYIQSSGKLIGQHNLYNIGAALLACNGLGVELQTAVRFASEYPGLEHRLEQLILVGQRLAINDSKATTVSASLAACKAVVESLTDRRVLLLIGGQEKRGSDWLPLLQYIREHAQSFEALWCFGESAQKLANLASSQQLKPVVHASLATACTEIAGCLRADNLALLSPGCASFDEFDDFEDRGRYFKARLQT